MSKSVWPLFLFLLKDSAHLQGWIWSHDPMILMKERWPLSLLVKKLMIEATGAIRRFVGLDDYLSPQLIAGDLSNEMSDYSFFRVSDKWGFIFQSVTLMVTDIFGCWQWDKWIWINVLNRWCNSSIELLLKYWYSILWPSILFITNLI